MNLSDLAASPKVDAPKGGRGSPMGVESITREWGLF